MINRISEIPFWGPEEQIRRFINHHDEPLDVFNSASSEILEYALRLLKYSGPTLASEDAMRQTIKQLIKGKAPSSYTDEQKEEYFKQHIANYLVYQQTIAQQRIQRLDEIYQKQLIWSYGLKNVDDAYFYQDWCPIGEYTQGEGYTDDPKWQMDLWGEAAENIKRSMDRSFDYQTFVGYQKSELRGDEMPQGYAASTDEHTHESNSERNVTDDTDLDIDTLRHNIMWSYLEVSEWLGDGAVEYGSQNGFVSRKMSLAWLFNAIKALINWKLANQDKWAEADIHPLVTDQYELKTRPAGGWDSSKTYYRFDAPTQKYVEATGDLSNYEQLYELVSGVRERFLEEDVLSTQGHKYDDAESLTQIDGCCQTQPLVRAKEPWKNGVQKVRGNEYHYGERAWFYTHTSFIGECRFYHNARFLGQTTFDKEINGTAMRARWAGDLAENYESDKVYEPGTLVMFGGDREITLSNGKVVNAIVSTKPGVILNGDEKPGKTMIMVALTGRVPVNVVGAVYKFDKVVPSRKFPGYARRRRWFEFFKKPIGIALSESKGGQVECATKLNF